MYDWYGVEDVINKELENLKIRCEMIKGTGGDYRKSPDFHKGLELCHSCRAECIPVPFVYSSYFEV